MADAPIRVVLFGGGAALEHGVKVFLARLEREHRIDLVGAFFQAPGRGAAHVLRDLWRRRRFLAVPLALALVGNEALRYLLEPRRQLALDREFRRMGPRLHHVSDIHSADVLDRVRALSPDLGLIYGSPILKRSLFGIPRHGTLGIHHGKLPDYRGKKTLFWAMYNGEDAAGVTIQRVNEGLDTGEIVMEGGVPIGRRSRRAVWHELERLGIDLYVRAILAVGDGTAEFRPFPGRKGRLYRDPRLPDLIRFWLRRTSARARP